MSGALFTFSPLVGISIPVSLSFSLSSFSLFVMRCCFLYIKYFSFLIRFCDFPCAIYDWLWFYMLCGYNSFFHEWVGLCISNYHQIWIDLIWINEVFCFFFYWLIWFIVNYFFKCLMTILKKKNTNYLLKMQLCVFRKIFILGFVIFTNEYSFFLIGDYKWSL